KFGDLGQKAMAGSAPVVISSDQSAVPVSGAFWQATQPVSGTFYQTTQPVSCTVTANLGTTGSLVTDANIDEKFGDLGQQGMAGSVPVVIASDQSAVPVSGTFY